jgi:hypothetical protein
MGFAVTFINGIPKAMTVPTASAGDIDETVFVGANNQSTMVNVTGLAFSNAVVKSFNAMVSVEVQGTADKFELFELVGIQNNTGWYMSINSTGDDSGIEFDITNAGQITYTSPNITGYVSLTFKFKSETTSV